MVEQSLEIIIIRKDMCNIMSKYAGLKHFDDYKSCYASNYCKITVLVNSNAASMHVLKIM